MTKIEKIGQVAVRLKGLRDALDLSTQQVANACNVEESVYVAYESGNVDIPVSFLHRLSRKFGVELHAILFDEDPKMSSYFVTRAGQGAGIERTKAYRYESLASGFSHRVFDPMMVMVEPSENPITLNAHDGQEWEYVVEGRMELQIGEKTIILEKGDSVMFDARRPHGMKALDGATVKFIAIIS